MIKVVIVEDSPVAQEFLTYILSSDPEVKVIGVARNGVEALEAVKQQRPDVITMDIHMPVMDGFEATRRIMETTPTPIVIVSGSTGVNEVASTFRAIEAGALAVVRRPPGINHDEFEAGSRELIQTVKLMSEVRVVKRFTRPGILRVAAPLPIVLPQKGTGGIQAVAIGASTGGPPVLKNILSGLPQGFPVPVFIVQRPDMATWPRTVFTWVWRVACESRLATTRLKTTCGLQFHIFFDLSRRYWVRPRSACC